MTTYNVLIGIVELIEADSPEAAIAEMERRVEAAGFDTYGESDSGPEMPLPHAFISDVDLEGRPQ